MRDWWASPWPARVAFALCAVIALSAALVVAVVLGWAAWWSIAAVGTLVLVPILIGVLGADDSAQAAVDVSGRGRRLRLTVAVLTAVGVCAGGALAVSLHTRQQDQAAAVRSEAASAAARTVAALMTFSPDQSPAGREQVATGLSGILLTDYRQSGPSAVVAGSAALGLGLSTTVTHAAVDTGWIGRDPGRLERVLVFADEKVEKVTAGPSSASDAIRPGTVVPISRWAVMERSGGVWRLAGLRTVGPGA